MTIPVQVKPLEHDDRDRILDLFKHSVGSTRTPEWGIGLNSAVGKPKPLPGDFEFIDPQKAVSRFDGSKERRWVMS